MQAIYCDPYQLHRTITSLARTGLPICEFPQTVAGTTRMGQALYDLLKSRSLVLYPDDELRRQGLSAVAVETTRGFRVAKERASRKIDAVVALALACVAALDAPAPVDAALSEAEEASLRAFAREFFGPGDWAPAGVGEEILFVPRWPQHMYDEGLGRW